MELTVSFFLLSLLSTSYAAFPEQNHLVLPHSDGNFRPDINCLSWRLAVETNNIRNWNTVPEECEKYIADYMLGQQYSDDGKAVADAAYGYAKSLNVSKDGKDVWVIDVLDTALSQLPYYEQPDVAFGTKPYNGTKRNEWIQKGIAPPVPAVLDLYNKILPLGYKIIFLSGSSDRLTNVTTSTLKKAGFHTWEKLILKKGSERGVGTAVYKSSKRKEIEEARYRIIGNVGDQWTDITGTNIGKRTFKIPNPLYYVR